MLKKLSIVALIAIFAVPGYSFAACYGSQSFQNCYDNNGNAYTVQRFGNSTYMNGSNSNGTWNQQSHSFGNMTQHYGQTSNGNSWNMTQQQLGGGYQSFSGTNSNGQSFNYLCGPYGCN